MVLAALLAAQLAAPPPRIHIANPGGIAQQVELRVSWPLPRHLGTKDLHGVTVGGVPARWRPMLRWADGSIAVAELRWRADVPAEPESTFDVAFDAAAAAPVAPDAGAGLPRVLPLHTELEDPWGRVYVARLDGVPGSPDEWGVRWWIPHVDGDVTFLGLAAILEPGRVPGHAVLTLCLDNGRIRDDMVLGPVRLRRFELVVDAPGLRFLPRFAAEHALQAARVTDRGFRQPLLGPSDVLYLGDGTAKAFRFDVFLGAGDAEAEQAAARAVANPVVAFPDLEWVRSTKAFGLHGGPAPVVSGAERIGPLLAAAWSAAADFGPFGGFGEPKAATAAGAPRHGPCALHSVLRLRSASLLEAAQAMALQGLLRPRPGHVVRIPEETAELRAGLSRRTMLVPHGFAPLDYEHVSVDLLFDLAWLSGDRLAVDELARQGPAIRALLEARPYRTCRGEGWCLQALAGIAAATGDDALAAWAASHVEREIVPRLRQHETVAIAQPPHPDVLDGRTPFDAPWQMAVLIHGLHAVYRVTDDAACARAALVVAERLARAGWIDGQGPKYFVSAVDAGRFEVGRADARRGPEAFVLGALVLASELARDRPDLQALFAARARELAAALIGPGAAVPPGLRADPWLQLWLDRDALRASSR